MDLDRALEIGREALTLGLLVSAPILITGLVVGLVLSLLQAITQVQEQTLTFVPKIMAMAIAAILFLPWIAQKLINFAADMFTAMPF
jgi:flagellar biosynthetic protein FliQ